MDNQKFSVLYVTCTNIVVTVVRCELARIYKVVNYAYVCFDVEFSLSKRRQIAGNSRNSIAVPDDKAGDS